LGRRRPRRPRSRRSRRSRRRKPAVAEPRPVAIDPTPTPAPVEPAAQRVAIDPTPTLAPVDPSPRSIAVDSTPVGDPSPARTPTPAGARDPTDQHALNFVAKVRGSSPAEVRAAYTKLAAIVSELPPDPLNAIGTAHFGRFVFLDPANDGGERHFRTLAVFTAYDHDFVARAAPLFDTILPLVESPEDLVPVSRNAVGFGAYLLENVARTAGSPLQRIPRRDGPPDPDARRARDRRQLPAR
jgi:hypothetical protein